jgi:hypothetical protein
VQLLNNERLLDKNGVHKLQNGLLELVPRQPLPSEHPCIVNVKLPLLRFICCLLWVNFLQANAEHFNQQLNQQALQIAAHCHGSLGLQLTLLTRPLDLFELLIKQND